MNHFLWLVLALLPTGFLRAQSPADDSTTTGVDTVRTTPRSSSDVVLHLSGGHLYQTYVSGRHTSFADRLLTDPAIASRWGVSNTQVSDNPLYHGASWLAFTADLLSVPGLKLHGEITGEHRGISYGVGNTRNMIVFPRFLFTLDTAVEIAGEKISARLSVGDSVNARIDQGLTFYNIDVQGAFARVGWRWLALYYENVGDGMNTIGLGFDDATQYGIALEDVPLIGELNAGARFGWLDYGRKPFRGRVDSNLNYLAWIEGGTTLSATLAWGDKARFYATYGQRGVVGDAGAIDPSALLLGAESEGEWGWLRWKGRAEYRRYGETFNAGFVNYNVYYRDTAAGFYGNTIGPSLYPLQTYLRPYNQWAVYTRHQEAGSVSGPLIQGEVWARIYGGLRLRLGFDMGDINVERGSSTSYAFYAVGLGWEPRKGTGIELAFTNRAMNLDEHYPTLYEYADPVLEVSLRWDAF